MRRGIRGIFVSALFALLVAPSAVHAQQGAIAGRVVDPAGIPLAQAEIIASGAASATALSDSDGRYRLQLPAGTYDLRVEQIGSRGEIFYGVTVSAGQTTTFDITLVTRAFELDAIVVTPRRGVEERRSESAAMAVTLSSRQITERPAPSLSEQLRPAPGVDIITQGVQSTNITVRGFNNIFSGALHMLSDNRLAGVPSLRVNLMHFIPTIEEDVDRIEVVLGPGSALYGPNTANGVVHIISKSPLDHQGTSASVGYGERSVFQGAFRTAFKASENLGFKLSGQYLQGDEWEYVDPTEQAARQFAQTSPDLCLRDKVIRGFDNATAQEACGRVGTRDFGIERYGLEARADYRFSDSGTIVGTYGRNDASGIELTGLGAGQTVNWVYEFYQARLTVDRLFAQAYHNTSDAGESWLLRDGVPLVDNSTLTVGQVQHGFDFMDGRQDFTYGFDYFATRPNTDGKINGSYEDVDDIDEWGVYLQSKTELTSRLDFIAALRMDDHSLLPEAVWSPRASLVFNPVDDQTFRLSYNRAFSTPSSLNFFLDISGGAAPNPLGQLGFTTRAYGTGAAGYGFQNADGSLRGMRSPFTPASSGGPSTLLPAQSQVAWQLGLGVLAASGALPARYLPILAGITPPSGSQVPLMAFDPLSGQRLEITPGLIPDVPVIEESNSESFELGWTGLFDNRVRIDLSGYYMKKNNFVSPLVLQTPLLLLRGESVGAYIATDFVTGLTGYYVGQGLDLPTALATATAEAQVAIPTIAGALGALPVGVVSSPDVDAKGADLILAYRNVGDIDFFGADMAVQIFLTDEWSATGSFSWMSDDYFGLDQSGRPLSYPVALNAPKAKGSLGLTYRNLAAGFNAAALFRVQQQFPAESAGYVGLKCLPYAGPFGSFAEDCVEGYGLLDLALGYRIPSTALTAQLTVTNLFDAPYRSFVGVPEVGRFAMVRLKYDLF